jgi:hypothetical protein
VFALRGEKSRLGQEAREEDAELAELREETLRRGQGAMGAEGCPDCRAPPSGRNSRDDAGLVADDDDRPPQLNVPEPSLWENASALYA